MSETLRKYGAKYNTTFCSLCGLSTDTKPTGDFDGVGIANGSEFIEMDTGKKFKYDAESSVWNEVSSGGGGSTTLIEKSIAANGEYNASDDSADGYSKVTVDVANSYTQADEGKVVSSGALVAQTTHAEITENGTYDITTNNSVSVNVSGGVEFSSAPVAFTLLKNIKNLNVTIPNGCTSIGAGAFTDCIGLESVQIPSGITSIGNYAFQTCTGLTSIEIPSGVTSIGDSSFYGCYGLTSVNLPNNITTIGSSAFENCVNLENINIPSGITSIPSKLFRNCNKLKNLEIPSGVTSIGNYAINGCDNLQFIKFHPTTPPTINNSNALSFRTSCIIYVPSGSLSAYTSAAYYPNPNTYTYVEY